MTGVGCLVPILLVHTGECQKTGTCLQSFERTLASGGGRPPRTTPLVATDAVAERGFMQKLEHHLRLCLCVHCQRYVRQIRSLGRGARNVVREFEAEPRQVKRAEKHVLDEVKKKD